MRPALDDRAPVEHDDLVGTDDGREAMRDHQSRAVLRNPIERVLDFLFGLAVERRGRFVEQQDGRALENGPRDGDALLLAAGGLYASMWNRQREAEEAREKLARVADDGRAPNRNPPVIDEPRPQPAEIEAAAAAAE